MITLCMDTSHTWLVIGLIQGDKVIGKLQEKCWKQQSEELFPQLIALCEKVDIKPNDIDQIVITEGPGSYTGVRIAMTVAKVFCAMGDKPLYTIPTLQLYAGKETGRVVLDARGNRVYTCSFKDGKPCEEQSVLDIEALKEQCDKENLIGDAHLFGKDDQWLDLCNNFLALKDEWKLAENVHLVVPEYLKSTDSYLVKK